MYTVKGAYLVGFIPALFYQSSTERGAVQLAMRSTD